MLYTHHRSTSCDESRLLKIESIYNPQSSGISIAITLGDKVLLDKRRELTEWNKLSSAENEVQTQKLHGYYNLESLGGMPKELKWAFFYLNKYNLTKHLYIEELHNKSSEKKSNFQLEFEKSSENDNKFVRIMWTICKTVRNYSNIFTHKDLDMLDSIAELDPLSLTLLAKMYFRKRVWYGVSQLSEYHNDPLKIKSALLKLHKMNILKDTGGVLLDKWNARVLLESLTSQETKNLAFEVNRLMMKYPPTMERHYYNYKAPVLSSPLIALLPYLNWGRILNDCIKTAVSSFIVKDDDSKEYSKFSK